MTGKGKGERHLVINLDLEAEGLETANFELQKKYEQIQESEQQAESFMMENASTPLPHTAPLPGLSRQPLSACVRKVTAWLIRPKTLWPFPEKAFKNLSVKKIMDVEMSLGQMVDDVKLACGDIHKSSFTAAPAV